MVFDRAKPETFRVPVLAKRVESGRHTTCDLDLPPWGPFAQRAEVSVPSDVYRRVQVGGTVCAYVNRGALHIRWYDVWPCPAKDGR